MNLSLLFPPKIIVSTALTTFSLVTIGNLVFNNTALAFSINSGAGLTNTGFENSIGGGTNPTNGWSTIGDVTTITANAVKANGINVDPLAGNNQAIITNAYNNINGTERIDDTDGTMCPGCALDFNQSGTNPVDADTDPNNHTGQDLQNFLGLNQNELSIAREPNVDGDVRTSKEGSGMFQSFTIDITQTDVDSGNNAFEISFNWAYLTNDGRETDLGLGNQDYSFFTLYDRNASSDPTITVLGDSNQSINNPNTANNYNHGDTTYYQSNNIYTTEVTGLTAGSYDYVIGFGVVDIDGSGRSSALVLDELGIKQVPFEFTPATGIAFVLSFIGVNKLFYRFKK